MNKSIKVLYAALLSSIGLFATCHQSFAQAYCPPSFSLDNSFSLISNVNFGGINNSSAGGPTAYSNFTTTVSPGQLTIGTSYQLKVSIQPGTSGNEYIYAFIDWNQNGTLDNAGEKYAVASGVGTAGPHSISIIPPATALTGNTRMRIMLDLDDYNSGDPCFSITTSTGIGFGEAEDYALVVQNGIPVTSVSVATQGGVPATISSNAGTLQMTATVLPANATPAVNWSIVPGTGAATISSAGLVTAQSNGTVWAKAVSVADVTKKDSMQITLSNQVAVASVTVATQGGVPANITNNAGILQMTATVLPAAAPQTVIWSIVPGTGAATISAGGLVTAQSNGTVWAKAVSAFDASKKDSLQLSISGQGTPVADVSVATQGGVPATITSNTGSLQMTAAVLPATAPQTVTWSIVPGTGTATISTVGLVTAQTNGTVWAKAMSTVDPSKKDSLQITISNQVVVVNSVTVATQGGVPAAISTNAGTLQMTASVLPATAPQTVTWSIVPGTGTATISVSGLVTAQTNGTVWAKAVSTIDGSKKDSLQIQLTNQGNAVNDLFSTGAVSVYPNPVINELIINFGQQYTDGCELSVVNLLGQEVYRAHLNNKRSSHYLAYLVSGTYILSIKDPAGNSSTIKITK